MVRTMRAVVVVAAAMRAVRHLRLRGAYCYAVVVVVSITSISISNTNTNTIKADAKPKRNKSTSTSILSLHRMVVVVRMAVGVRVESHRLRYWIARRASKMPAFIFADVSLELERVQMNDTKLFLV